MSGSQGHAVIWIIPTEEQWVRETKHEGGCAVQFHWHHTKFTYRQSPSEKVAGRIVVPSGHFPGGSDGKAPAYNAGDPDSIPGSGRSPGEGNGNPLQYSCLENPMDGGSWWATVHGVAKSRTWPSDFTFTFSGASMVPRRHTEGSPVLITFRLVIWV